MGYEMVRRWVETSYFHPWTPRVPFAGRATGQRLLKAETGNGTGPEASRLPPLRNRRRSLPRHRACATPKFRPSLNAASLPPPLPLSLSFSSDPLAKPADD